MRDVESTPVPPVTTQACAALNKQGERYRADVKADTVYCFQHHPERAEQAAAARKQGVRYAVGETRR